MFLGWFDDTPKKSVADKLEEAVERYVSRFGESPDLCLINEKDITTREDIEVRVVEYVRPNHFWIGKAEALPPGATTGRAA